MLCPECYSTCPLIFNCILTKSVKNHLFKLYEMGQKIAPRKCYKIASRLNRYNLPTVNAIDFLFSTLHATPFHYGETYFGALHQFRADATRSDTPWGSKPPHLQVGAFKSLQIQYVRTGVLLLLMCSVR